MISQLPDHLICQILYHLPTENAVRTSLLSTRWTSLWKSVPGLDLDSCRFSNFKALASVSDRFFDFQRESRIHKFRLMIHTLDYVSEAHCVTLWIDAALTSYSVQHLEVRFQYNYQTERVEMPLSLYICERLVHLRLYGAKLFNAEFVSLPCLKIMQLEHVSCPNEATLEKLISSSPVLEDLKLLRIRCNDNYMLSDNAEVLQVRSKTVKRIDINQCGQVVIDNAPLLQFLRIHLSKSFRILCSGFSAKVDLNISYFDPFDPCDLPGRSVIHDILTDIWRVSDLVISNRSCEVWYCYFDMMYSEERDQISYSSVPECLKSSLEFVDIKTRISEDATEMKLVRYFLDNSAILKKLTLRLHSHPKKDDIFKELLGIPKRSITCQVVVV
ncbi:unnamed protein product [Microthlaspi erraticum]|uniref:F-box domain-containing protein n=1 Tax=Microthlaspi erraticum TaxID=1685480 RepID=A0A6D2IYT7_9BRAS|nr:unnamed protein product [Microthlaspi erraticum]